MDRKAHGFTVVELLIAIIVIGILAAISIVVYTGIRGRANDVARASEAHQIEKSTLLNEAKYGSIIVGGSDVATISREEFLKRQGIASLSSKVFVVEVPPGYNAAIQDSNGVYRKSSVSGTVTTYSYDKSRTYVYYIQGADFWSSQTHPYSIVAFSYWSEQRGTWISRQIRRNDTGSEDKDWDGCAPAYLSCYYDSSVLPD